MNWKAFDKRQIYFLNGVNFLVGRNAIGKTSILEAISVALTGEALTVDDPKKLVREGCNEPASISLDFIQGMKNYQITRTLSKDKKIASTVLCNREIVARNWDEASRYVRDLLGIDKNFFERVIYMSEGHLFSFLSYDSKNTLFKQVEQALEIDRIEDLRTLIKEEKDHYQKLEIERKKQVECFSQITLVDPAISLERKEVLEINQKSAQQELETVETYIFSKKQLWTDLEKAFSKINSMKTELAEIIDIAEYESDFLGTIKTGILQMNSKLDTVSAQIDPKIQEKGSVEERITSLTKILDLLLLVEQERKAQGCPVCGKTLYADEVASLISKFQMEKQENSNAIERIVMQIRQLDSQRSDLKNRLQKLESAKFTLTSIYDQLQTEVLSRKSFNAIREEAYNKLSSLEERKTAINSQLKEINNEFFEVNRSLQIQSQAKNIETKEQVEFNLVSASKVLIALDILESAANRTIEWERQDKLKPTYDDIADVWNRMKGGKDTIRINEMAIPVINRDGHTFELKQLSGGEKTALLTIIRTVLCRKFSQAGFMLLDEPLEHLDLDNRRMVIDFLVQSFESNWVDQLIVTTFEETLLRKFQGYEKVNIIAL